MDPFFFTIITSDIGEVQDFPANELEQQIYSNSINNTAFPRTYSYRVFRQGYDVVFDSLTVINQNIVLDVVLHSPSAYLLFEDFEGSSIPSGWTALFTDFTELSRFVPQEVGFGWFEYDLSTYTGSDQFLAWEYDGPNGRVCLQE